tara:strand:+ start:896 stop:1294 length:399 start_codon:yes stop_codon:yes gene_type:complete
MDAELERIATALKKKARKIKNNPEARARLKTAINDLLADLPPSREEKIMTTDTARKLPNDLIMKIIRIANHTTQVEDYWAGRKIMIARFCALPYKAWIHPSHPARYSSARDWDKVMSELKHKQDITPYPLIS